MYWETRMRIHQQKHTLAKPCFFFKSYVITNHITDALSDLNWAAVLARPEPCVKNRNAEFTLHDFQTRRIAIVFTLHDYLG